MYMCHCTAQCLRKEKEKFTIFSDHNGSLLRRQPGAYRDSINKMACMMQTGHLSMLPNSTHRSLSVFLQAAGAYISIKVTKPAC